MVLNARRNSLAFGIAIFCFGGERLLQHIIERAPLEVIRRSHVAITMGEERLERLFEVDQWGACEHLDEDHPHLVDIDGWAHSPVAHILGGSVLRSADEIPCSCQPSFCVSFEIRNSEIENRERLDLLLGVFEKDIRWLEVTVDDPMIVSLLERVKTPYHEIQSAIGCHRPLLPDLARQSVAGQILHHDEWSPLCTDSMIIEVDQVGVAQ